MLLRQSVLISFFFNLLTSFFRIFIKQIFFKKGISKTAEKRYNRNYFSSIRNKFVLYLHIFSKYFIKIPLISKWVRWYQAGDILEGSIYSTTFPLYLPVILSKSLLYSFIFYPKSESASPDFL